MAVDENSVADCNEQNFHDVEDSSEWEGGREGNGEKEMPFLFSFGIYGCKQGCGCP